ncbi:MAG TPA: hypothetical protein VF401_01220 [Candidatus Saccharimonadales bacterium]
MSFEVGYWCFEEATFERVIDSYAELRAQDFINAIRRPHSFAEEFDMLATTRALGIQLEFSELNGHRGLYVPPGASVSYENSRTSKYSTIRFHRILCETTDPRREQQLTTGHELGHYFLYIINGSPYLKDSDLTEDFCEYFGHQLVDQAREVPVAAPNQLQLIS